jgi:hypothetical protein
LPEFNPGVLRLLFAEFFHLWDLKINIFRT